MLQLELYSNAHTALAFVTRDIDSSPFGQRLSGHESASYSTSIHTKQHMPFMLQYAHAKSLCRLTKALALMPLIFTFFWYWQVTRKVMHQAEQLWRPLKPQAIKPILEAADVEPAAGRTIKHRPPTPCIQAWQQVAWAWLHSIASRNVEGIQISRGQDRRGAP